MRRTHWLVIKIGGVLILLIGNARWHTDLRITHIDFTATLLYGDNEETPVQLHTL